MKSVDLPNSPTAMRAEEIASPARVVKKPWSAPEIVQHELLETVAAFCEGDSANPAKAVVGIGVPPCAISRT